MRMFVDGQELQLNGSLNRDYSGDLNDLTESGLFLGKPNGDNLALHYPKAGMNWCMIENKRFPNLVQGKIEWRVNQILNRDIDPTTYKRIAVIDINGNARWGNWKQL